MTPHPLLIVCCCAAALLAGGCPPKPAEGEGEGEGEPPVEDLNPGDIQTFAGIEFAWIPAGGFIMGGRMSAEEVYAAYGGTNPEYFENEHPAHYVELNSGFWMSCCEIRQKEWEDVMGYNPSHHTGGNLPVESVTWHEAVDFTERLSAEYDGSFDLPTEAQWEYACRAGTNTAFYHGNDAEGLDAYGWYIFNSLAGDTPETQPVGRKKPNLWGLYDMHGNVWEWCRDWYDAEYYAVSPAADPEGPASGAYRVIRSGTFKRSEVRCRSAFRSWNNPEFTTSDQGLRIIRWPDAP
jgi:formylglycine-generating enzyme required for sulfatase activity